MLVKSTCCGFTRESFRRMGSLGSENVFNYADIVGCSWPVAVLHHTTLEEVDRASDVQTGNGALLELGYRRAEQRRWRCYTSAFTMCIPQICIVSIVTGINFNGLINGKYHCKSS